MTSINTSNTRHGLRPGNVNGGPISDWYCAVDTRRSEGPPLPPNGTPTRTPSLERLNERLERLAFGGRPEGHDAPPLETYTTTATEHGDVVRATPEYVRWFHRAYPASGSEDRVSQSSPRPTPQRYGGEGQDLTF